MLPKKIILGAALTAVCFIITPVALWTWEIKRTEGSIVEGVKIGTLDIGGASFGLAQEIIENQKRKLEKIGVTIVFPEKSVSIYPLTTRDTQTPELQLPIAQMDTDAALKEAMSIGRTGTWWDQLLDRLAARRKGQIIRIPVRLNDQAVMESIRLEAADVETKETNAQFSVTWTNNKPVVSIKEGIAGTMLDEDSLLNSLRESLAKAEEPRINTILITKAPSITAADASLLVTEIEQLLSPQHTITVRTEKLSWEINTREIANALTPTRAGDMLRLTINPEKLSTVKRIANAVFVVPKSAIFTMEDEKVTEFRPEKEGVELDQEKFLQELLVAFQVRKSSLPVPTKIAEPEIRLVDANPFGIKEELGSGWSSFKGSPSNRIKNISNGTNLLNYTLIKPGEEFSLVNALKPFDEENGYLPELVIKDKKIEPEIGGGLCQIGTTIFRAAMNSGLPITERRNHSLVISYYSDPANGLPGSDATIYDPSPDFKFKNDTGHGLLIVAQVTAKQELEFSIWGQSDGRKGSYAAPVVEKWIPYDKEAKTQYLESTSVKPGAQSCRSGYNGAIAKLLYTVIQPNGEKQETTFTSYYRMLPPICLVAPGEIPKEEPEPQAAPATLPVNTPEAVPVQ